MASNYIVAGSVGKFLREEFSSISRHMMEDGVDEIQRRIILNTESVRTTTALGRPPGGDKTSASQFQAIHPVSFGRAGTIKYQALGTLLGNDSPPMLAKNVTYPAATTVPQRAMEWLLVDLKWILGNLTLDQRQWLALKNGSPVEDFLASWMKDPYEIFIQQITTDFFGSGYGVVAQVAANVTINAGAEGDVTLLTTVRKLWRGQRIAFFNNSSGVPGATWRGTDAIFVVTKVHSFTTTPTISVWNTSGNQVTLNANDWAVLEGAWNGSASAAVSGLDLFTNNSAGIHGLSKSTYPELRSYVDAPGTARNPTPVVFQKAVDAVFDRGFKMPDLWATTRGVRSLYYQQQQFFAQYNTELANPVQRGADGGNTGTMQYTTEQGVVPIMISPFVPKGRAYLIRLDALIRYAPGGLNAVQFLGDSDLLGGNMFLPSTSSDNYTPIAEAPFHIYYENGCTMPQCLGRIEDLNELSDVS